ncbi:NosD domain-containing protein [Spirochaeta isovalerica]|uniref:Putative outer membrane repeat protein n=1 Tax=Spirochaeta isovalerica TaxID=150 RepID=A0A841RIZ4_9SPIO|nr:right-handed parallel beta-helix repeat-containing protein [Spirochaeta isovalerica]MBB6482272.1 putative outer membrane repeat protein [Spirochaeta isovalerica]
MKFLHKLLLLIFFLSFFPACRSGSNDERIITVGREDCDYTSLREAVEAFSDDWDRIVLMDDLTIESGIDITKEVTISGRGMKKTILAGGETAEEAEDRIFFVKSEGRLILEDLSVTNGRPYGLHRCGGAIASQGFVRLERVRIADNQAVYGVGIWNEGEMEIYDSLIENNTGLRLTTAEVKDATGCTGSGGGIKNEPGGVMTIKDTTIRGNTAMRRGGGVFVSCESQTVIDNCLIEENYASYKGGAIHVRGDLTLVNTRIVNNDSRTGYGGILNKGRLEFEDNIIKSNGKFDFALGDSESGIYGKGIVIRDENNRIGIDNRREN